jgi:hypothetical protein
MLVFQMMSRKRKFTDDNYQDGQEIKQRQRMTTYHQNSIFRM